MIRKASTHDNSKEMTIQQRVFCPTCDAEHVVEMEEVTCNLCHSSNAEFLFTRGDLALGLGGEFRLVRCLDCGLIYMNPRPTVNSIGYYYPSSYSIYSLPDVDSGHTAWSRWARGRLLNKRCRTVTKHERSGRLLDVGCANGRFLHQMRRHGNWERQGVELVEAAADDGRKRYDLDIQTGTLESAELPLSYFDVVTLWDVLEHVHDPVGTFRRIAELLRPEGLLVFSVPIADSIGGRFFGKYWVGYEIPRHLHIFTRDTLSTMLALAGFHIVEDTMLHGSNYAFADSVLFSLRGRGVSEGIAVGAHWFLCHRMWRLTTAPYFWAADRMKLTSVITVVCRLSR